MLHREHGGGGSARHADLVVDVLDVVLGGPRRDREGLADLAVRAAPGHRAQDFDLSLAQAGRSRDVRPRPGLTGGLDDGGGGCFVEPPATTSSRIRSAAASAGRAARWARSWVIAWKASATARIRAPTPSSRAADPRWYPGPIESLVVHPGHDRRGREGRGAGEDALRVVGMEPDLLPLGRTERSGSLPDLVRDADAADVVERGGNPESDEGVGIEPEAPSGGGSQARDTVRMPERVRRLEVRDVTEHRRDVEQPRCGGRRDGRRLRVEDRGVRIVDVGLGEDRGRGGDERGRHRRVEHPACSLLDGGDRELVTADVVEAGRDAGQADDAGLDRDRLAPEVLIPTLAVPALEDVVDPALDALGQAQTTRRGLADLADGGDERPSRTSIPASGRKPGCAFAPPRAGREAGSATS